MPRTRLASLFSALAFTLLVIASTARADDLTTTAGKKLTGKVVSVDGQGVTFTASEASVKVAGRDIVLIDFGHKIVTPAKDAKFNELELTDGSTFRIGKFLVKGKKVEFEPPPGPPGVPPPTLEVPLGAVFSIMRSAEDPKAREAWKKMLATRGKRDLYVIREEAGLNFVQGTILAGDDAGTRLNFEKEDGTKTDLLLSRATGGLVFSQPAPAQVPLTLCKVHDVFGNSLTAQAVELTPSGVAVTTVSGVVVKYQATTALSRLDYAQGNVAYLSDLLPLVDAPGVPADEKGLRQNVTAPYLRDQSLANDGLRLGTETFPKGLWVAPETVLTYALGGDYGQFKAVIGIEEIGLNATSEARVTLEADGRVVFAETLRRKEKAKPVVLSVKGVKQLRVIVEAETPVNGNFVILGDARVEK